MELLADALPLLAPVLAFPVGLGLAKPEKFDICAKIWSITAGAVALILAGYAMGFQVGVSDQLKVSISAASSGPAQIPQAETSPLAFVGSLSIPLALAYWQGLLLFGHLFLDRGKSKG